MRILFGLIAGALLSCGSSQDDEQQANSQLQNVLCVESQWDGTVEYDGHMLRVESCVGEECSAEFDVEVHSGSSCLRPLGDGEAPPPGDTPLPDGQALEDLSVYASSSGGRAKFAACALRGSGNDAALASDIRLNVKVTFGSDSAWAAGETASLQVRGADDSYLVDTSTEVGPVNDLGTCVPRFDIEFQSEEAQ